MNKYFTFHKCTRETVFKRILLIPKKLTCHLKEKTWNSYLASSATNITDEKATWNYLTYKWKATIFYGNQVKLANIRWKEILSNNLITI